MPNSGAQMQLYETTVDLLIKQVTEGLSRDEERVLESLDGAEVSHYLRDFEAAAAAVTLAGILSRQDAVPTPLLARIEADANAYFGRDEVGAARLMRGANARRQTAERSRMAGWWAAAACLLLAILGWRHSQQSSESPPIARAPVTVAPAPPISAAAPAATLAEQRKQLLGRLESIRVNLQATKDPAASGVAADVVWNPVSQQGFLHLVGLRANDPRLQQYQAWIFDGERDKRYPVDAGVFDVAADSGEVIVPLHSALPIRFAKAFAITVEKPGGVVVSALQHVVALGATG